jgi:hypothetical protein
MTKCCVTRYCVTRQAVFYKHIKFAVKLCVKLCVTLSFVIALSDTHSTHGMQKLRPLNPSNSLYNLERALTLLGDEENDGEDAEFFTDISRELEALDKQLNPPQRVYLQRAKTRNRSAEFARDRREEKENSEHENAEHAHEQLRQIGESEKPEHEKTASELLESLFAGYLTREEALLDEYPAQLSLSPEEESELLGNPDPSSPTGSLQIVRGFHPSSLFNSSIPERPRSPKAHQPQEAPVSRVAQLLVTSPILKIARAPQKAQAPQPAPNTPRYRSSQADLRYGPASMSPGKTGDLDGDIMRLYAIHQR